MTESSHPEQKTIRAKDKPHEESDRAERREKRIPHARSCAAVAPDATTVITDKCRDVRAARGLDGRFASRLRVFAAVEFVLVVEEGVDELAEWIVRGGSFG